MARHAHRIVNIDSLLDDLRLSVTYAARVGLLHDPKVLTTLKAAEQTAAVDKPPDVHALTLALSDVSQLIAPITLADLKCGRDPFEGKNQASAKRLQLLLTVFTLAVLVLIAFFMTSLRREQNAIATLSEIQELRPGEKLTSLRKLAQFENPLVSRDSLYDHYHQRVDELLRLKDRISASNTQALAAVDSGLFPFQQEVEKLFEEAKKTEAQPAVDRTLDLSPIVVASLGANALVPAIETTKSQDSDLPEICAEDSNGDVRLTADVLKNPAWMRTVYQDVLNDYCFQLKIIPLGGESGLINQPSPTLIHLPMLKDRVAVRTEWILPFLYGLLGSAVFMMRNISSVRTPAIELLPILMRISLGGVAGIVIGWFSASSASLGLPVSASFLPFGLAFLTGYGIEVLFKVLDKVNTTIGSEKPARA